MGNTLTGGLTQGISNAIGQGLGLGNTDDMVDRCSSWYTGGQIAGAGLGLAMGDGEGVEAGVVEDLGEEGGCFVAGTQIQMADGSTKSIDKIKVGDEVKSRDPATGKDKDEPVLRLYIHPAPQIMELHLSDGEVITCTPEHRFYVPSKGFEEAGTLSDGDRLVHDDDATSAHSTTAATAVPLKISDITWDAKATSLSAATTVYNFEVASTHTYFVGSKLGGVWVHNDCTDEASRLLSEGKPGQIYRLQPDPDLFPNGGLLGNSYPEPWYWHDVLYDSDANQIYDPTTYGSDNPVDFDTWASNFPWWDIYSWGPSSLIQ
jgi:hypothetical protein